MREWNIVHNGKQIGTAVLPIPKISRVFGANIGRGVESFIVDSVDEHTSVVEVSYVG